MINRIKESTFKQTFYKGVIEDNNDPDMLGRCKVRILELHTSDTSLITTEMLPWSYMMGSSMLGFTSGIGISSIPVNGTWVWVILDGDEQTPIIVGTIIGMTNEAPDSSSGFSDPDGTYPLSDRLGESDINRIARVDSDKWDTTAVQTILDNVEESASDGGTAEADVAFTEKDPTNDDSTYPDVTVIESKSGHVIEIDDTEANPRIRIFHTSGTYYEMTKDGSTTTKVMLDDEKYVVGNNYTLVKGDSKLAIEGNSDIVTVGYKKEHIEDTYDFSVTGNTTETHTGAVDITNEDTVTIANTGTVDITNSDAVTESSKSYDLTVDSGITITESTGGISLTTSGNYDLASSLGSTIHDDLSLELTSLGITLESDVTLDLKGTLVTLEGSAITEVKGALVKIGDIVMLG